VKVKDYAITSGSDYANPLLRTQQHWQQFCDISNRENPIQNLKHFNIRKKINVDPRLGKKNVVNIGH
jgi:hypothetical protein